MPTLQEIDATRAFLAGGIFMTFLAAVADGDTKGKPFVVECIPGGTGPFGFEVKLASGLRFAIRVEQIQDDGR